MNQSQTLQAIEKLHEELLNQRANNEEIDVERIQSFLKTIAQAGKSIENSQERSRLRDLIRYWSAIIDEKTGELPIVQLQPFDISQTSMNEVEIEEASSQSRTPLFEQPPSIPNNPRRVYIAIAGIIILLLVLGSSIFVLPSLLSKPSPDLFPALCSGNFQSTNAASVPTPATSTSLDGETIGLSEGAAIFDLQRPNQQEVQYKLQAAQDIVNNPQGVVPSLRSAIGSDPTDAEAQIYLENWRVLTSSHPHITFVVGVSFDPISIGASRDALQGAYTAQKECNDRSRSDESKTLIVLMIANAGGDSAYTSTNVVVDQIVNQAAQDKTIVGIMGWPGSGTTINAQAELIKKHSNIPILAACSSSDYLTGTAHFFRICPRDADHAPIAANFLLNVKKKKRIAILYDNTNAFTQSFAGDFVAHVPSANIAIQENYIVNNLSDLHTALSHVLAQNPDAIFFAGYASDLMALLNDPSYLSYASSHNLIIMGSNTLATTSSYTNPFPNLHNVYFTSFASPNAWDNVSPKPAFFQEYQDNFKTTTAPAGFPSIDNAVMLAYDGISTLLYASQQVLSTKNTITPSDVEAALKQITGPNAIQGVTGRISFNSYGDQAPGKMIFVEHIEGTNLVIDETHGCLLKDSCGS